MRIRFSDPFDTVPGLQRALEGSMFSDWFGPMTTSRGAFPLINVFKRDGDFVVIAELPGAQKEDFNIQVHRNQVRISGKREVAYEKGASMHRAERVSGSFDRMVTMPAQLEPEKVRAEYRDGILAVYLPRAEHDKPRSVQVA